MVVVTHSFEIRTLEHGEWALLRQLRLRALREAPEAFGPSARRERLRTPSYWHEQMDLCRWFVAEAGHSQIGFAAGSAPLADHVDERHLLSLWVSPDWRRRGVARDLIEAVASWAAVESARSLSLWVFEQNKAAINVYERLGFSWTGHSKPYDSRQEMRMIMRLPGRRPEAGSHPAEF